MPFRAETETPRSPNVSDITVYEQIGMSVLLTKVILIARIAVHPQLLPRLGARPPAGGLCVYAGLLCPA